MGTVASGTTPIQAAIQALQWQVPYLRGGDSTSGMDPAGLVYWVMQQAGVTVPSTAQGQYYAGENVPVGPPGNALAYAQPGDVIFQGTADPDTETEAIIYSTAGNGTAITSAPGQGVSYGPIAGQVQQIRRFWGSNNSGAAAPYSSTTPTFQEVSTDYKPVETATSSMYVTPEPKNPRVYTSKHYEFLLLCGVAGVFFLLRNHVRYLYH